MLGSRAMNLLVLVKSAAMGWHSRVQFWCWKTTEMSQETGGETGNQTRWQSADTEIGFSETRKVLLCIEKFT